MQAWFLTLGLRTHTNMQELQEETQLLLLPAFGPSTRLNDTLILIRSPTGTQKI